MPDVLLGLGILIGAILSVVVLLCSMDGSVPRRVTLTVVALEALMIGWAYRAAHAPRSAVESEFYEVHSLAEPGGMVSQVIATKRGLVNLTKELNLVVPPGKRVHRIVYSPWRRGVLLTGGDVEYTVADDEGD